MNLKTHGAIAVVPAAAAVIGVKVTRRGPAQATATAAAASPSVVLIADLRESDSECGCGQIIRRVREAKARGVDVREIGHEAARQAGLLDEEPLPAHDRAQALCLLADHFRREDALDPARTAL